MYQLTIRIARPGTSGTPDASRSAEGGAWTSQPIIIIIIIITLIIIIVYCCLLCMFVYCVCGCLFSLLLIGCSVRSFRGAKDIARAAPERPSLWDNCIWYTYYYLILINNTTSNMYIYIYICICVYMCVYILHVRLPMIYVISLHIIMYQKGRFIPPKPELSYLLFFDTTPFICLWQPGVGAELAAFWMAAAACATATGTAGLLTSMMWGWLLWSVTSWKDEGRCSITFSFVRYLVLLVYCVCVSC